MMSTVQSLHGVTPAEVISNLHDSLPNIKYLIVLVGEHGPNKVGTTFKLSLAGAKMVDALYASAKLRVFLDNLLQNERLSP